MQVRERTTSWAWAGPLAVTAAFAGMLAWSWGRWPDPVIDFGKELYIAWQLSAGRVLYRDIAYFLGPLSPYVNAAWFKLFGVSLMTLVIANVVVAGAVLALLYFLIDRIGGRLAAAVCGVTFATLFAFAQLTRVGNYNYATPYVHEVTHGMLLSLGALACLWASDVNRKRGWVAAAGALLGLTFLTRSEIFVAAAGAVVAVFAAGEYVRGAAWRSSIARFALLLGAAVVPVVVAFGLLAIHLPARAAVLGTLGSWPAVVRGNLNEVKFFQLGMGTLNPRTSLMQLGIATLMYATVGGVLYTFAWTAGGVGGAVVGKYGRGPRRPYRYSAILAFVVTTAVAGLLWNLIEWREAFRPLPLVMIALIVATVRSIRPDAKAPKEVRRRLALRLGLTVFGLLLLLKMILLVRIRQYGFALAMPATLLLVEAIIGWLPRALDRRGGDGGVFRGAALGLWGVAVVCHLIITGQQFAAKRYLVGSGADAFLADARAREVNAAVDAIRDRLPPGGTLAVLPEGAMLNYLTRRTNPTPYLNFQVTEMVLFGEDRMLAAFEAHPPDYIALVHRDTSEFGPRFFATDYGTKLSAWIGRNYRQVDLFGSPPLRDERFGILLLKRVGA